jgi:hypothetical protein
VKQSAKNNEEKFPKKLKSQPMNDLKNLFG